MADTFYALTVPGADLGEVTVAASTQSTNIELRVTDGVSGNNKTEVLKALEAFKAYITTANAPN